MRQRWKFLLNKYDFQITHIKGKDADTLSLYFVSNDENFVDKNIYNIIE